MSPANRAQRDLVIIAFVVLGFFVLAGRFELSETIGRLARPYEAWQADEAPLTLLILAVCLVWFIWRRAGELRQAISLRDQAEALSQRMLEDNRRLVQRLLQLQEQERAFLARELHDEFGQACVAIRVEAATIARVIPNNHPEALHSARAISQTASHLHDVLRARLAELRPAMLDELGLIASLRDLIERWQVRNALACSLEVQASVDGLSAEARIALYRCVQEGLTNIARHAQARQAVVALRGAPSATPAALLLTIEDDGVGCLHPLTTRGTGLAGMRERVDALGGRLDFARAQLGGLRVEVSVPLAGGVAPA